PINHNKSMRKTLSSSFLRANLPSYSGSMLLSILLFFQILPGGASAETVPSSPMKGSFAEVDIYQHTNIALSLEGVPLRRVLKEIEKQSSVNFFFSNSHINIQRKVTFRQSGPLDQVMNSLFSSLGIGWEA